eukprot:3410899-Pleurochrysis_carterae.AAC.1
MRREVRSSRYDDGRGRHLIACSKKSRGKPRSAEGKSIRATQNLTRQSHKPPRWNTARVRSEARSPARERQRDR